MSQRRRKYRRPIAPGDRVRVECPHSGQCTHLGIAGKEMFVELLLTGGQYPRAQFYKIENEAIYGPEVHVAEAGINEDGAGGYYVFSTVPEGRTAPPAPPVIAAETLGATGLGDVFVNPAPKITAHGGDGSTTVIRTVKPRSVEIAAAWSVKIDVADQPVRNAEAELRIHRRRAAMLNGTELFFPALPKLYSNENTAAEEVPIGLKIFTPDGQATWFVTEADAILDDEEGTQVAIANVGTRLICDVLLYGFANLGDDWCAELGYASLREILSVRAHLGLAPERDCFFGEHTLAEVMDFSVR